jgi:site-specific recombinase XerC
VVRLLTVTTNRKQRALLMATYAAGLRASEVTHLKVADIDSQRMSLRIVQGKECHSYCISRRPRHQTTGKQTCQQAYDLASSWADGLLVVRTGIGRGPYTDAHAAGRVEPRSEPYPA